MKKIIFSQVRDLSTAINVKVKLIVVSAGIALITYEMLNNRFFLQSVDCQFIVLVAYIIYIFTSAWYLYTLVPIARCASDQIIIKVDGIYVERSGKLVSYLKWEDISEVGFLPGSGPRWHLSIPVYFSPRNLDRPIYLRNAGDEREVFVSHEIVWYASNDLSFLTQVLFGFDEWLKYACDLQKVADLQSGNLQITNISMRKSENDNAELTLTPLWQYQKLTRESRHQAMVISAMRTLYVGYAIVFGGWLITH